MQATDRLTTLFEQAKAAHSDAFAHVDGHDPDWSAWYAEWLHPRVSPHLHEPPGVEELGRWLARFAEDHASEGASVPWPRFYAVRLLERCGGPPAR